MTQRKKSLQGKKQIYKEEKKPQNYLPRKIETVVFNTHKLNKELDSVETNQGKIHLLLFTIKSKLSNENYVEFISLSLANKGNIHRYDINKFIGDDHLYIVKLDYNPNAFYLESTLDNFIGTYRNLLDRDKYFNTYKKISVIKYEYEDVINHVINMRKAETFINNKYTGMCVVL